MLWVPQSLSQGLTCSHNWMLELLLGPICTQQVPGSWGVLLLPQEPSCVGDPLSDPQPTRCFFLGPQRSKSGTAGPPT